MSKIKKNTKYQLEQINSAIQNKDFSILTPRKLRNISEDFDKSQKINKNLFIT